MATTVAIISIATTIIGAVVTASSQIQAGNAQASAAKFNARVAENNAQAARDQSSFEAQRSENEAQVARNAAKVREDNIRRQGVLSQSEGVALSAASGVEPSEGSPLLVLMENQREIEIAARREQFTGELQAGSALSDAASARFLGGLRASGFESEARLQRFSGSIARRSGVIGAGATLLTGAGSAASAVRTFSTRRQPTFSSSSSVAI